MSTYPTSSTPFPALETERLVLRKLSVSDIKEVFFLRSNPEVNQFIARKPLKDEREALDFIQRILKGIENKTFLYWAICLKGHPTLVGTICLWNFNEGPTEAELGYELHTSYEGNGIMSEAMNAVLEYGFDSISLTAIEAYTQASNLASIRLLQQKGFIHQANRKDEKVPQNAIYRLESLYRSQY